MVGVPYSDEMIASASADFRVQVDPFGDYDGLLERYPGAWLPALRILVSNSDSSTVVKRTWFAVV